MSLNNCSKRGRSGWFIGRYCSIRTVAAKTQPLPRLQKIFFPFASVLLKNVLSRKNRCALVS